MNQENKYQCLPNFVVQSWTSGYGAGSDTGAVSTFVVTKLGGKVPAADAVLNCKDLL
jgi:hypothetical protein